MSSTVLWRSSIVLTRERKSLLNEPLLAQPVGTFRERAHAIQPFAGGDVERLLAGPGESDIGALPRRLDGAEVLALGIEHLHAGDRRDVDPILIVERKPIGAALHAGGDVAQLGESALV